MLAAVYILSPIETWALIAGAGIAFLALLAAVTYAWWALLRKRG